MKFKCVYATGVKDKEVTAAMKRYHEDYEQFISFYPKEAAS